MSTNNYQAAFEALSLDLSAIIALLGFDSYTGVDPVLRRITELLVSVPNHTPLNAQPIGAGDDEPRHDAVKALHDVMQAVPCASLYSLAEAVLDAGYGKPGSAGWADERAEFEAAHPMCETLKPYVEWSVDQNKYVITHFLDFEIAAERRNDDWQLWQKARAAEQSDHLRDAAKMVPAGKLLVSAEPLRQVLSALVNAPHQIRELQATRVPVSLFADNPINVLIAEYEAAHATPASAASTDQQGATE